MFGVPALTMRLIADENKAGTIELLLTAPIRDFELIIGKWLGSFLFVFTVIVASLIYPILLNRLVTPGIDWLLVLSSYLGLLLVAGTFLALGVGISALFSNQIAAFFVSLVTCLGLFFLIGIPAQLLPTGGELFGYLVMRTHFDDAFNLGSIHLTDLVYFFSLIALGLFTGTVALESRRWN
jgi:ABC-2 type transport system permease protein